MELKEPHSKSGNALNSQPAFPIFIESEIGISIDNWVPIVCTGIFQSRSVVVTSPAEISALYCMGNFGKGSNSRSTPYIVRNHPKVPPFMRKRQFEQRDKWSKGDKSSQDTKAILELHLIFAQLTESNIIHKADSDTIRQKTDVVDILSSDEDEQLVSIDSISNKTKSGNQQEINAMDLEFPSKSVVVLSDSDAEKDDYFKDLKPKLCIDSSELYENLLLTLEEAYFLAYGLGCLQIVDENKKILSLEASWSAFCDVNANFPIRYGVYHYFRCKGWIVKPGIKFGGDYILYKKGQSFYHASYIVIIRVINANDDFNWLTIQNQIRLSATAAKEILLAQVILPESTAIDDLKKSCESVKSIKISETLLRRWTAGQKQKEDDN